MIDFDLRIADEVTRENTRKLEKEFKDNPVLNGEWKLFERSFDAAGVFSATHDIPFKPVDMIITANSCGATITFDREKYFITAASDGSVRFILGRMTK